MSPLLASWLQGLLLGVQHAADPDHVAAIAALVEDRKSGRAVLWGTFWGVGHALAIFTVGGTLLALRSRMPDRISTVIELLVGIMLLGIGARAMSKALWMTNRGPSRLHRHGRHEHEHPGSAGHVHLWRWTFVRRPLLVGLLHGLAGSGSVAVLAMATMPSLSSSLLYVVLFGLGSTASMGVLAGLAGAAVRRVGSSARARRVVVGLAGGFSTAVGFVHGWPRAMELVGHWVRG